MSKRYSVEQIQVIVSKMQNNISDLLTLNEYSEAVVVGYNEFKDCNGLKKGNINLFEQKFAKEADKILNIYKTGEQEVLNNCILANPSVTIKSVPIANANKSIRSVLRNADSGAALMGDMKIVEDNINTLVTNIINMAEEISQLMNNSCYVEIINEELKNILGYAYLGIEDIGAEVIQITEPEEKYFEK